MYVLYSLFLHYSLINIHIFDYPDSRLSGLLSRVPTSPDNRGSTVVCARFSSLQLVTKKIAAIKKWKITGWQNFNDLKHSL